MNCVHIISWGDLNNVAARIHSQLHPKIMLLAFRNLRSSSIKSQFYRSLSTQHSYSNTNPIVDRFNRQHTYLRISLTEKCNLRCLYCMPDTTSPSLPSPTYLTAEEILRLSKLFVSRGVNKIRLTGGEPLIRSDILPIVASLAKLPINTLALTTNAVILSRHLKSLEQAGLNALNISLDSLREERFELITRRKGFNRVFQSIQQSLVDTTIPKIRINVVIIKNFNEDELIDFINLTQHHPQLDVRFIEYMPFDGNKWSHQKFVSYASMLYQIGQEFAKIDSIQGHKSDTAKYYQIPGYKGKFGFITSMTDHFCSGCNRIRLTADGNLKVCLFGNEETSLRDPMRDGATDEELNSLIDKALYNKHFALGGNRDMFDIAESDNRSMVRIGG